MTRAATSRLRGFRFSFPSRQLSPLVHTFCTQFFRTFQVQNRRESLIQTGKKETSGAERNAEKMEANHSRQRFAMIFAKT